MEKSFLKIFFFSKQFNVLCNIVVCLMCLQPMTSADPPKGKHQQQPLMFKSWPPSRNSPYRSNNLMVHLRGSGSANVPSRVAAPGMFIKTGSPFRFAFPSRMNERQKGSLGSPSTHVYFKSGHPPQSAALKRPYGAHLSSPGVFKFSTPAHKTAIKFQSPPQIPVKSKPEYIYEKVNVPNYSDRYNIGSDGAIHTIPAPNLSLKDGAPIPEVTVNNLNLNNQFDSDLSQFSAHGFALENPSQPIQPSHHSFSLENPIQSHQYQVRENINDLTFKNPHTGQQTYYAPDSDPSLRTQNVRLIDDPLSIPSDGKPKPNDVLYHQSLDFSSSPLIQGPQYAVDPYGFPVSTQPQLQQYHLLQNTMMKQGMPLASLNPTYLVMQSNNLLGQHQQHLTSQLFRPENGYIDTAHVTSQPGPATYSSFDYTKPQQVASLGQIYSAQQDQLHQNILSSTPTPSTITTFIHHHDGEASQSNPTFTQQHEPKPSNYQYSPQHFIDLPDENLSQSDIHNLLNYNDMYQEYINHRQLENDVILREAQEKLQKKLSIQHQQEQNNYDLHQLVQQEKFNPLRIVVPDDDQGVSHINLITISAILLTISFH